MGTGDHQVFHPELVDLFRMVLYKNGCINYYSHFINVVFMCRFTWEQGGLTLPWRSLWGLGSGRIGVSSGSLVGVGGRTGVSSGSLMLSSVLRLKSI